MFDGQVMNEGLGRAEEAMHRERGVGRRADGLGNDGLGAYVVPEQGDAGYPYPQPTESSPYPPPVAGYGPMAGEVDFIEPDSTSPGAAMRSAGFTLLFVALSTGVGYALRGGMGAAAGLLLSGGVANGYRAQKWFDSADPSEKHEAIVSTIFAVGEVGVGAYVAYRASQEPKRK